MKTHEANETGTTNDTDENSIDSSKSKLLNVLIDSEVSTQVVQCLEPVSDQNVEKYEDDNTLSIDNKSFLDIDRIQEHEPEDDRIVNTSFFLKEMHRTFDNHARGIECLFKDWHLVKDRRCGLLTQFFFKCQMCNYEDSFWSHPTDNNILNLNMAITARILQRKHNDWDWLCPITRVISSWEYTVYV